MKTAEEWVDKLGNRIQRHEFANQPEVIRSFVRAIQLDALKESAEIVEKRISFVENLEPAQVNNQQDRRAIMESILSLIAQLEEKK